MLLSDCMNERKYRQEIKILQEAANDYIEEKYYAQDLENLEKYNKKKEKKEHKNIQESKFKKFKNSKKKKQKGLWQDKITQIG